MRKSVSFHGNILALPARKTRARKSGFPLVIQADLGCPVGTQKTFCFS
jgi:hypothetical protein